VAREYMNNEETKQEQAVKRNHKRKQFFKESPRHVRGKLLLSEILRSRGFKTELERRFHCNIPGTDITCRYQVDVYGYRGTRRIIAEVDGYRGHKTKYAISQQNLRSRRILERYGKDIEIYRFTFSRLSKWSKEEIAEEMKL
jgi:hypothetical protein